MHALEFDVEFGQWNEELAFKHPSFYNSVNMRMGDSVNMRMGDSF